MREKRVVTREQWLKSRSALLDKEKALTRLRDELSEERRNLPWVAVEKEYRFRGEAGEQSLRGLFGSRSQLMVYHFMFGPDWEEGCPSCSFWADNYKGILPHLDARDLSFVTVSRAPLSRLLAYRERLGWNFPWVSSLGSDFNFDYQVSFRDEDRVEGQVYYNYRQTSFPASEAPGISVFRLHDGVVYHTYSTYSRGLDMMNGAYHYLDLSSKGRDEAELPYPMAWVRRNDSYS